MHKNNHKKWSIVTPKKEQQNRNFLNIEITSLAASFVRKNPEMYTLSWK